MYIYKTTNVVNGKIYIGQCAKQFEDSKNYLGSGTKIKLAIKKYGRKNFIKQVLKDNILNQKQLDNWEFIFIKKFNSCNGNIGYNILTGTANKFGGINPMSLMSVRNKISGENFHLYGKKWDENKKQHYSKINLGKNNPNFGNKWTEEQKLKMKGENNHMSSKTGDKHPLFGCTFEWINNGKQNKRLNTGNDLPEGFIIGKLKYKN